MPECRPAGWSAHPGTPRCPCDQLLTLETCGIPIDNVLSMPLLGFGNQPGITTVETT